MSRTSHRIATRFAMGWLLLAVLSGVLHLIAPAPAQAEVACTAETVPTTSCPPAFAPPDLLSPRIVAKGTAAQADSLRRIQKQAVDLTLAHYQLPESDRNTVLAWGRTEAQAMLWGLLVQALKTPAGDRTADQRNAREWLATLLRSHVALVAREAGAELTSWLGLDPNTYASLAANASYGELRQFLLGNAPLWILKTMPSVAEVLSWGAASAYETTVNDDFASRLAAIHAVVNAGAAQETSNRDPEGSSGAPQTLLAARAALPAAPVDSLGALYDVPLTTLIPGGHVLGHVPPMAALAPWSPDAFDATRKRVYRATGELVRALPVDGVVGTQENIAALVVRARTNNISPEPMLDFPDAQVVLFSAYVTATLPGPRPQAQCDNSLIPVSQYGSPTDTWVSFIHPVTSEWTTARTAPCLNAPVAAAPTQADPQFVVRPEGATTLEQRSSISVRINDDNVYTTDPKSTVRLSGRWFVQRLQPGPFTTDVPTLGMEYTDWTGRRSYVSLVHSAERGFHFLGVTPRSRTAVLDPSTCGAQNECWDRDSINYVDPDGRKLTAWVDDYQKPAGAPWHGLNPVVGSPVAFDANGFAPAYNNGGVSYEWRFQKAGCNGPCVVQWSTEATPDYTTPVRDAKATYTWEAAGTYLAHLTATDVTGQVVTTTMKVVVGGIAPVITLPSCNTVTPAPGCSPRIWAYDQLVKVTGTIELGGTLESASIAVEWGDGTPVARGTWSPAGIQTDASSRIVLSRIDGRRVALTSTHLYEGSGEFHGSVTVTDGVGTTERFPFMQVVAPPA